jgi:hypothetical protein
MSGLGIALAVLAAFLLGLRAGIGIGMRAERRARSKGDLPRSRA